MIMSRGKGFQNNGVSIFDTNYMLLQRVDSEWNISIYSYDYEDEISFKSDFQVPAMNRKVICQDNCDKKYYCIMQ